MSPPDVTETGGKVTSRLGRRVARWLLPIAVVVMLAGTRYGILRVQKWRSAATGQSAASATYPKRKWRLVPEKLPNTVLSVSSILLRHKGAMSELPAGEPLTTPDRTEAVTAALAETLAEELRRDPSRFDELAVKHSDDRSSAPQGGRLGLVPATLLPNETLDAFAALREGQISRPIRTILGYQLLRRNPTPPETNIAWREIVIAFKGCNLLPLRPGQAVTRNRDEARVLAWRLYDELRAAPERFQDVVEKYSDHHSALNGGRMGTWSNYRPEGYSKEIAAAADAAVSQVAAPIETADGFKIVQHAPLEPTERFAAAAIQIHFDRENPESSVHAEAIANDILRQVVADPSRFRIEQAHRCCKQPFVWTTDRGPFMMEQAIRSSKPDEAPPVVVKSLSDYFIVRRVQPQAGEPAAFTELQESDKPDMSFIVRRTDGTVLASLATQIDERARTELALNGDVDRQFVRLTEQLRGSLKTTRGEQRLRAFKDTQADLANLLGPSSYQKYENMILTKAAQELMAD